MRDVGPREAAHSAYSALDSAERPPGPVLAPGKDLCAPASPVRRGACPGGRAGPGATGRKRSHFPAQGSKAVAEKARISAGNLVTWELL